MSNNITERVARATYNAVNLAVEVAKQDEAARARGAEQWQRVQDDPLRQDKSRWALAFNCYVHACGYSASVKPVLLAALAATYGADRFVPCADWRAACYLRGDGSEIARLEKLPASHPDKRALAKAWRRAWDELEREQRITGYYAVRRKSGRREHGKNKASELYASFAQHLVEIDRLATGRRGRRLEKFTDAARELIGGLTREPAPTQGDDLPVRACPSCSLPDCEHTRPAPRRTLPTEPLARYLAKVQKATVELLNSASTPEEKQAVRLRAHQAIEQLFADDPDPEPELPAGTLINKEGCTDESPVTAETAPECDNFARAPLTEPAKNQCSSEFSVPKNGTLDPPTGHTCPSPSVDPELIEERVFIMCEADDVSEIDAAAIARRDLCETCQAGAAGSDNLEDEPSPPA
jgi:hypothetical protein